MYFAVFRQSWLGGYMKKLLFILKILVYSLYAIIIVVGIAVAVLLLMGFKLYCIQTGSMEPEYPVGSMIVVEHVDFEQLKEKDVITYVVNDNTVVTHRVVSIDTENQMLMTKGDNNNIGDGSPVAYKNVIGRVKFKLPRFGWVILFLDTRFGKIMLGIAAFGLFGVAFIKRMYYRSFDEESENDRQDPEESGDAEDEGEQAELDDVPEIGTQAESEQNDQSKTQNDNVLS